MRKSLKLALVHLEVKYRQPEINRNNLIGLNRSAALKGADIILNSELPVTGYSFSSREDISEFVESGTGETISELSRIARQYGKYIGTGLAERDDATGIYYNSALVVGPDGGKICGTHKISAETRWACPGDPKQKNTFDTPWGRLGVLICSDSYHGLLPRSMALKGVDLLWVPANWPPGGVDAKEVWQARVIENGFYLAACGRSGKDRIMDCRDAVSCVYDFRGRELFSASSGESTVFLIDIPLDSRGKLCSSRLEKIGSRSPSLYRSIYLDHRLADDITTYHELPEPGPLHVHCIVPEEKSTGLESLERRISEFKKEECDLFVLPPLLLSDIDEVALHSLSKRTACAISAALVGEGGRKVHALITPEEKSVWVDMGAGMDMNDRFPFPTITFRTAKVGMASLDRITHPELAVAFAKQGYDLVTLSEDRLESHGRLLCGTRTIENIAVAACASNGAVIAKPPQGHERWEERDLDGPGICSFALDTCQLRKKRFQDRVDFQLLLKDRARRKKG